MEFSTKQMQEVWEWAVPAALEYGSNILEALIILVVGLWLASWLSGAARRTLDKYKRIDSTLKPLFASLIRYTIVIMTIIAILSQFGVQTASIIAILGAAGLAIGLALQGTLQNIAAGIMLLILRPFRVGDFIDAGPVSATVDEIGLFTSQFTTVDGIYVSCPNSSLWNSKITNYSRNNKRRMDLVVGISYEDDIGKAVDILMGLMQKDDRVLKDPAPQCMVTTLGDSSVNLTMRMWALSSDFWALKWDMTRWSKEKVEEGGLSIPFPQRDVHLIPAPTDK
ncbi:MAG: mechanosensitive ion channel [Alphaproteobacteria bacterium]|uniref:mechanosensitive ion channel family protein n=1 Tax=Pacificispira sp. TaxID=2888761 RepID=UPI001B07E3FF|nr:mechanosensitive ion channel [Alphaproteobacteria bacterium]MBO6863866.1 mechanosensitive ion channel [Alphaproteobacteria bacterium]MEC9266745.1 mechanosensitive ion channel domain-containing protein [Pseudomonadota bacterium]